MVKLRITVGRGIAIAEGLDVECIRFQKDSIGRDSVYINFNDEASYERMMVNMIDKLTDKQIACLSFYQDKKSIKVPLAMLTHCGVSRSY